MTNMTKTFNPPHPGEVLREWLAEMTVTEAARRLGVTRVALSRVLNGSAGISAEMDLRLSKALGTAPGVWFGMQADYDLSLLGRSLSATPVQCTLAQRLEASPKSPAEWQRDDEWLEDAPQGREAL